MMKINNIILLINLITYISCSIESESVSEDNVDFDYVRSITVHNLNEVKEIPYNKISNIKSELKQREEIGKYRITIPLQKLLGSIKYIKLESNLFSTLGEIDKIIIANNRIYILDIENTKSLLIFNLEGRFLYKISATGKGPGEYYKPSNFFIRNNGNIEIFDRNLKKIIQFDRDGDFLDEKFFDYWVKSYTPIDNYSYMFYTGFRDNINVSEDNLYNILITDENFNIENVAFPISKSRKNLGFGASFVFSKYDSSILYKPTLDNNIYSFDNSRRFYSKYYVDFGDYKIPEDIIANSTFENRQTSIGKFRSRNYASDIRDVFETDDYLTFRFTFKNRIFLNFYNKTTNTLIYGDGFVNTQEGIMGFPKGTYDDQFIFILEPYTVLQTPNLQEYLKELKGSNEELYQLLNGWNMNSNPIIVLTKFK